jgi:hypothetical protein
VQQVAAQPVQLGDQQRVEPAGHGRCCQLIQGRARGPGAGDTSIDILADQGQAVHLGGRLTLLALDADRGALRLRTGRDPQIHHRTATTCRVRLDRLKHAEKARTFPTQMGRYGSDPLRNGATGDACMARWFSP